VTRGQGLEHPTRPAQAGGDRQQEEVVAGLAQQQRGRDRGSGGERRRTQEVQARGRRELAKRGRTVTIHYRRVFGPLGAWLERAGPVVHPLCWPVSMAGAPTKKDEQSTRSRERLVAAATQLFAQRGYRDASVQAIAEAAGISRGSIFWHFGSKEGLLSAVAEAAFRRWEAETLVGDVGDARGLEAVRRALDSHQRFLRDERDVLRLFFVLMFEALGPRPELAERFAALHRGLRERGSEWLRDGDLREDVDPETVAALITGALGGIAYQHLLDPDALDLERTYADLGRALERGLAAAPR
jgi:TetR/AcrR family acrAB operon transcriptional repressor